MPYCKSCGAYIPDGLSACLACGYDESAQSAAAAAKKAEQEAAEQKRTQHEQEEYARQEMERQRRIQQEKNRKWAEEEKARRDRQAENRKWAREEYARRQTEQGTRHDQQDRVHQSETDTGKTGDQQAGAKSGNYALAALSYLDALFVLPYFLTPNDDYTKYHAKQGFKLFLFTLVTRVLKYFTAFGWIFTLLHFYLIYKGIKNALGGKKAPLPYIGTIGDK